MSAVSSAPLFIDNSPNMSMMEIPGEVPASEAEDDLRLIIIDYLQLMSSRQTWSPASRRSRSSPGVGNLAKEPEVPVVAISQLNRGGAAHRPQADDERPARVRLDRAGRRRGDPSAPRGTPTKDSPRMGEADIIVAKSTATGRPRRWSRRSGPLQPFRGHAPGLNSAVVSHSKMDEFIGPKWTLNGQRNGHYCA